ncbi:translation initiation factor IF-2 [Candidatus Babeliales bacterium]|nr:translation initiation factor IF-2 [Candidatus Babeliales bacterium]
MRIKDFSFQYAVSIDKIIDALKDRKPGTYDSSFELSDEQVALLKKRLSIVDTAKVFKVNLQENHVVVVQDMTVGDLAQKLQVSVTDLIVQLLKRGIFANKNQVLKKDQIKHMLDDLHVKHQDVRQDNDAVLEKFIEAKSSSGDERRLPTVVVVGHVDHGKTSFLDYVRKARVAESEKGGITQQVAAYEVTTKYGNLVFVDTPGHEAFSLMRERGVLIADLVVLMVALDDGIKPQTIESIKIIKNFGATAIVALNKVDKVAKDRIEIVKRQLADQDLLPEDWGGQIPCVPISAKTGEGIDELLELLRLQADLMDLRTDSKDVARGFVLESKMEHGRGSVATIILQRGTIARGDHFVCGSTLGKVSSIKNYAGKTLAEVGPSVPAQIAGFSALPQPGDVFEFVADTQALKKHTKAISMKTSHEAAKVLGHEQQEGVGGINVILKASTLLSKEALLASILKMNNQQPEKIRIIDVGVGDINENNVDLALTTGAVIYGLSVKANKDAIHAAKKGVVIKTFDIIYQLLDAAKESLVQSRIKKVEEKQLGVGRVKAVFRIKSVGIIAGAGIESGVFSQGGKVKVIRNGTVVGRGVIKTLQKDRNKTNTVSEGSDCAFAVDGFDEWQEGDMVYHITEVLV